MPREIITMRGRDRDALLPRARIVSTSSGGSNSQQLRGTPEYHEACNIMEMPGHAQAIQRQAGRVELAELAEAAAFNINPPPPIAPREGLPATGQKGKAKDQWQTYHAQKGSQFHAKGKWHQGSWDAYDSSNWWQPSSSSWSGKQ